MRIAEIAQLVERNLAKVEVAGPSPVFRSKQKADNQTIIGFLFLLTDVTEALSVTQNTLKSSFVIQSVTQKIV